MNYIKAIRAKKLEERKDNVKEFISVAMEFESKIVKKQDLETFLTGVALNI